MQQVLFHIPILKDTFPPDGIPVHGFGVMLFITFLVCVWFLGWRARRTGTNLPRERVQDLVIVVFVGGLLGARLTFMIQYGVPLKQIFRIWEGGIVLYGGIVTGMLAFLVFYYFVLKKVGVSIWKLADVAGPGLALGIALGRVGCFLNGCCYGHVAPEGCPAACFPLLNGPSQSEVVQRDCYQTLTGFTFRSTAAEPQSVVTAVEPVSAAERAGLKPGDRIVDVNGQPNSGILLVTGQPDVITQVSALAIERGAKVVEESDAKDQIKIIVDNLAAFAPLRVSIDGKFLFGVHVIPLDLFTETVRSPIRGQDSLTLVVRRDAEDLTIGPFTPRTLGLHPTQVYETISMFLLILFLLAYYPFRAYDGQVFTLFIAIYAIHRFLNETLRNDTDIVGIPALHMTLSQNISVLMLLFALCLEIGHRRWGTMRKRTNAA
jgi:phosphatidylglycerol---prolipoprotein diacylglyceryl transferase